jgi:hypothetical protein
MKVQAWRKRRMSSQRDQYGGTVHLFIGTGYNPYKITYMPFTFGGNSIVIYRGLNGLFIFKSVPFSVNMPKLSCFTASALCQPSYLLSFSLSDTSPKIPVHTLYSRNTVKSCFWGPSEAEGPQHPLYLYPPQRFTLHQPSIPYSKHKIPFSYIFIVYYQFFLN